MAERLDGFLKLMTRDNLCTWITNNAISIGGYDNYNIYIKRASFLPKSSRQVDITLLHLARDLAYFFLWKLLRRNSRYCSSALGMRVEASLQSTS
jgi:hypothetical protein